MDKHREFKSDNNKPTNSNWTRGLTDLESTRQDANTTASKMIEAFNKIRAFDGDIKDDIKTINEQFEANRKHIEDSHLAKEISEKSTSVTKVCAEMQKKMQFITEVRDKVNDMIQSIKKINSGRSIIQNNLVRMEKFYAEVKSAQLEEKQQQIEQYLHERRTLITEAAINSVNKQFTDAFNSLAILGHNSDKKKLEGFWQPGSNIAVEDLNTMYEKTKKSISDSAETSSKYTNMFGFVRKQFLDMKDAINKIDKNSLKEAYILGLLPISKEAQLEEKQQQIEQYLHERRTALIDSAINQFNAASKSVELPQSCNQKLEEFWQQESEITLRDLSQMYQKAAERIPILSNKQLKDTDIADFINKQFSEMKEARNKRDEARIIGEIPENKEADLILISAAYALDDPSTQAKNRTDKIINFVKDFETAKAFETLNIYNQNRYDFEQASKAYKKFLEFQEDIRHSDTPITLRNFLNVIQRLSTESKNITESDIAKAVDIAKESNREDVKKSKQYFDTYFAQRQESLESSALRNQGMNQLKQLTELYNRQRFVDTQPKTEAQSPQETNPQVSFGDNLINYKKNVRNFNDNIILLNKLLGQDQKNWNTALQTLKDERLFLAQDAVNNAVDCSIKNYRLLQVMKKSIGGEDIDQNILESRLQEYPKIHKLEFDYPLSKLQEHAKLAVMASDNPKPDKNQLTYQKESFILSEKKSALENQPWFPTMFGWSDDVLNSLSLEVLYKTQNDAIEVESSIKKINGLYKKFRKEVQPGSSNQQDTTTGTWLEQAAEENGSYNAFTQHHLDPLKQGLQKTIASKETAIRNILSSKSQSIDKINGSNTVDKTFSDQHQPIYNGWKKNTEESINTLLNSPSEKDKNGLPLQLQRAKGFFSNNKKSCEYFASKYQKDIDTIRNLQKELDLHGKLSNILENTDDKDLKKILYNLDTALDRIQNMEERRKDINNLTDSIETILQNFGNPAS